MDETALRPRVVEALKSIASSCAYGICTSVDAPHPDLVVFLQAPVDVLMERIARRGRPYEKHIQREYMQKLSDAYTRFFHQYTASPLLIVNAAEIDPTSDSRDFEELFAAIRRTQRGRHYFNPVKS